MAPKRSSSRPTHSTRCKREDATGEISDTEENNPTARWARTRDRTKKATKKARVAPDAAESSMSEDEGGRGMTIEYMAHSVSTAPSHHDTTFSWTAKWNTLKWNLVNIVFEKTDIKKGLFPKPGENLSTAKGGGKRKTKHHLKICHELFAEHSKYQDAFNSCTTPKQHAPWAQKIKNKVGKYITSMFKNTQKYMEEMGQTGAGLTSVDMILAGTEIVSKWDIIKKKAPWYFEIRALISEHPNLVPTGLGNSATSIDMDHILASGGGDEEEIEWPSSDAGIPGLNEDEEMDTTDACSFDDLDDEDVPSSTDDIKHPSTREPTPALSIPAASKKTAPRKSSVPPAKNPSRSEKKTARTYDKFNEIAKAEEETVQQALKLKQAGLEHARAMELERIHAAAEGKRERDQLRAEVAAKKIEAQARAQVEIAWIQVETHSIAARQMMAMLQAAGMLPNFNSLNTNTASTASRSGDISSLEEKFGSFRGNGWYLPDSGSDK